MPWQTRIPVYLSVYRQLQKKLSRRFSGLAGSNLRKRLFGALSPTSAFSNAGKRTGGKFSFEKGEAIDLLCGHLSRVEYPDMKIMSGGQTWPRWKSKLMAHS